jgi:hypothetical protein
VKDFFLVSGWTCTGLLCLLLEIPHGLSAQTNGSAGQDTHNQVSDGAAPNRSAFVPMTESERLRLYLRSLVNPISLVSSAAAAGIGQWRDSPKEWEQGAGGYSRRYGSSYAENIVRQTMIFGTSSLFHEDNRYIRSEESSVGRRVGYAVASTFLARKDDGRRRFSFSRIMSFAGAAFISRQWQPPSTSTNRSAAIHFGTSLGVAAGFNVAREFLPGVFHGR